MSEVKIPSKGMSMDFNDLYSNKETYLFALNALNESENGDIGLIGNENSNEPITSIKTNYTILGHVYIGDGQTCIFSVSNDNTKSEIGILENDTYRSVVESSGLNFDVNHQIQATYRLRRGCNKTVYWVDGINKPRQFDFQNSRQYQNHSGKWLVEKFDLQKSSVSIPQFNSINILESGELYAGAYQVSIQYIDDNNNATEWMNVSKKIIIYNDSLIAKYDTIHGSVHQEDVPLLNFPKTNKAIEVTIKNFDTDYKYLRLCFIGYHNGTGTLSGIYVTDKFATTYPTFTFTGNNYAYKINREELIKFQNIVATAKNITQLDNKLILGNITNKQVEWCKFQKYASLIQADCVVKKVDMNTLHKKDLDTKNEDNPKHPLCYFNGSGYMPGEMYSFGIVYILADGTYSPVFHIPGKSPDDADELIFSVGDDIYPMSKDNQIQLRYDEKESCSSNSYWGYDYNGKRLGEDVFVRHHRFPTRKAIDKPHIEYGKDSTVTVTTTVQYKITGEYLLDILCPPKEEKPVNPDENKPNPDETNPDENETRADDKPSEEPECKETIRPKLSFRITYLLNGNEETEEFTSIITGSSVGKPNYTDGEAKKIDTEFILNHVFEDNPDPSKFKVEVKFDDKWIDWNTYVQSQYQDHWKTKPILSHSVVNQSVVHNSISSNIFGIKFSNILLPELNDVKEKVVGYYIVQQERTDEQKSILDTGILIPTIKSQHFSAVGLLAPSGDEAYSKFDKKAVALMCPSNLFMKKDYDKSIVIEQQGTFNCQPFSYTYNTYNDISDKGSTYEQIKDNKDVDREWDYDDKEKMDTYSATIFLRDRQLLFEKINTDGIVLNPEDIAEVTSLMPFESIKLKNSQLTGYNMIQNQNCVFIELNEDLDYDWNISNYKTEETLELFDKGNITLPYVLIKRKLHNAYSNFRTAPFYQCSNNYVSFTDTASSVSIFNGNIFNSAIRLASNIYFGDKTAPIGVRKKTFWEKTGAWLTAGLLAALGVGLAVFTGGSSLALGLAIGGALVGSAGAAIVARSQEIQYANMARALKTDYKQGLLETASDEFIQKIVLENNYNLYIDKLPELKKLMEDMEKGNPLVGGVNRDLLKQFEAAIEQRRAGVPYTDDTFIIVNDTLTSVWFESEYNAFLRTEMIGKNGTVLFPTEYKPLPVRKFNTLPLPNKSKDGEAGFEHARDIFTTITGTTDLERFVYASLFQIVPDKGLTFLAVPLPEFYFINPDYLQFDCYQKYFSLPQEYDCCSECKEKFPHRWMWSENAFAEELSDSFRLFKPNNYKDIPGDTGAITNLFVYGQNLYIHTQEALWLQPKAYQERVTDEIVTYVGTGEYGNLPARKIINDSTGMSAGLEHTFGAILTKYGYFFVSYNDRTVYQFAGQLNPISEALLKKWFEKNIKIDSTFHEDNPASLFGSGFVWGYDPIYQRMLLTKQDNVIDTSLLSKDDKIIGNYIFYNFEKNKQLKLDQGWVFDGFVNKGSKYAAQFSKTIFENKKETIYVNGFPDMDYLLFYYDFTESGRSDLDNLTILYINGKPIHAVGWHAQTTNKHLNIEDYYSYHDPDSLIVHCGDNIGKGLESFYLDIKKIKEKYPNITSIQFHTYGNWYGNKNSESDTESRTVHLRVIPYRGGTMELTNYTFHNVGGEFVSETEYGYKLDPIDVNTFHGTSKYVLPEKYSPMGKYELNLESGDLTRDGKPIGAMKNIKIPKVVTTQKNTTVYDYIYGTLMTAEETSQFLKSQSWTISYSLFSKTWISFHSYLPNTYITQPYAFYNWSNQSAIIWKHNKSYNYQKLNGIQRPFIIEYVNNADAIVTKITDAIKFYTEAFRYDENNNEMVSTNLITFNKAVLYNSRQCSGLLELRVKDQHLTNDYLQQQVSDTRNTIQLDRNEKDWSFNSFRDIRTDYNQAIWSKNTNTIGEYIDKTLNTKSINVNKPWTDLEPFRDKYLIVRFIFDNFDSQTNKHGIYKLLVNYFINTDKASIR